MKCATPHNFRGVYFQKTSHLYNVNTWLIQLQFLSSAWCSRLHCAARCSPRRGVSKASFRLYEIRNQCHLNNTHHVHPPALYQLVAWSLSCKRKSGPATRAWSVSTSTRGSESPFHHKVQTLPWPGRRPPLIQCAKVKFASAHFKWTAFSWFSEQ